MTTMTVTDFARSLRTVFDRLEHGGEEIVLTRRNHAVAKLIPGAPAMKALDVFADLYGIIPEEEGAAWLRDSSVIERTSGSGELRDPWAE
jgi:antitoxin (DNA-binding transcriptional repressor) of toxin-antitoxin stability system